jgi:predicted nucleic acid-binding protein
VLKVYIETTIPSYLAARASRDIIVAAQQQITIEWWEESHLKYDLYVSEAVLDECRAGDADVARRRLGFIDYLPILKISDEVVMLAVSYSEALAIPEKSKVDAVHLASCVVYEMDYLLTWNCKHLAHGEVRTKMHRYNNKYGLFEPMVVTPLELMERS